jgi:hypothetical protein
MVYILNQWSTSMQLLLQVLILRSTDICIRLNVESDVRGVLFLSANGNIDMGFVVKNSGIISSVKYLRYTFRNCQQLFFLTY